MGWLTAAGRIVVSADLDFEMLTAGAEAGFKKIIENLGAFGFGKVD